MTIKALLALILFFCLPLYAQDVLHPWAGYSFNTLEAAFQSDPMLGDLIAAIERPKGKVFKYFTGNDIFVRKSANESGLKVPDNPELAPNESSTLSPDNTIHILAKIKVKITYDLSKIDLELIERITAESLKIDPDFIDPELVDVEEKDDSATLDDFSGESVQITAWCKIHDIYRTDLGNTTQTKAYLKLFADRCKGTTLGQLSNQLKLLKIFKEANLLQPSVTQPKIYTVERTNTGELLKLVETDCENKTYEKNSNCYQFE
ncbi:MAG: hypothetical protein KDK51_00770 [Deltaproteobacteria bacterium]|nr:hypothetical protein [Deltaproteobacteria bacterium]